MANEGIRGVLPVDRNLRPIQVLALDTVAKITVIITSVGVAYPTGALEGDIVRVACDTDCYIKFGLVGDSASSSDHLFLQGVEYFQLPADTGYIHAIRVSADGVMTISAVL